MQKLSSEMGSLTLGLELAGWLLSHLEADNQQSAPMIESCQLFQKYLLHRVTYWSTCS